jgi:hypothetical protein
MEITDAEKRELMSKVYPRLKKRTKILRFFRMGNAVLMLLLLNACAATAPVERPDMHSVSYNIKKGLVAGADPDEFMKTMPDSDITLSSIVKYTLEPTVKHIADDVIDLDYENGRFTLLKGSGLETNRIECPKMFLPEDKYLSMKMEGDIVLVTGVNKTVLADVSQCGVIYETSSLHTGFSLSNNFMLEFTNNAFELYDNKHVAKISSGSFLGAVVAGSLSGNNIMFANENGKIAIMSARSGKYRAIYHDTVKFKQLYYEGDDIYVYDEDNKLMKLTADYESGEIKPAESVQAKDGCFFLKRGGMLFCDGYIFGLDIAYESPADADSGLIRDGLIFLKKEGVVNFIDTTLTYKKSLSLASTEKKLCLNDGRAYFRDFDNSVKYISAKGDTHKVDEMPAECDHRFDFKKGALQTPDGREIYRFAKVVNSSDKAYMLRRELDGNIYYYFERLSD